jgi:hypothetical protein
MPTLTGMRALSGYSKPRGPAGEFAVHLLAPGGHKDEFSLEDPPGVRKVRGFDAGRLWPGHARAELLNRAVETTCRPRRRTR